MVVVFFGLCRRTWLTVGFSLFVGMAVVIRGGGFLFTAADQQGGQGEGGYHQVSLFHWLLFVGLVWGFGFLADTRCSMA